MCPTNGSEIIGIHLRNEVVFTLSPPLSRNFFQCHSKIYWNFFWHLQWLHVSTYLRHLDYTFGFLHHISVGLDLGLWGSWFRAGKWLGPLIWSYHEVAPGIQQPLSFFLKSPTLSLTSSSTEVPIWCVEWSQPSSYSPTLRSWHVTPVSNLWKGCDGYSLDRFRSTSVCEGVFKYVLERNRNYTVVWNWIDF